MKQLLSVGIKLLGFYLLFQVLRNLLLSLPFIVLEGIDKETILYFVLPLTTQVLFFFIFVFKTNWITPLFRLNDEPPTNIPHQKIFEIGIFLLGFYFFLSFFPNVIVQMIQWLISEVSVNNSNSLSSLTNLFSLYDSQSLLYSLAYSAVGFIVALKHRKIAYYFLK